MLTIAQVQELGAAWFGSYLDTDWRPRTQLQSQALLARLGLTGRFWEL